MLSSKFSPEVLDILTTVPASNIKIYNNLTKWSLSVLTQSSAGVVPEYSTGIDNIWEIFNRNPAILEQLVKLDISRVKQYQHLTEEDYRIIGSIGSKKIKIIERITHRKLKIIESGHVEYHYPEWTNRPFWKVIKPETVRLLGTEDELALEAYTDFQEQHLTILKSMTIAPGSGN